MPDRVLTEEETARWSRPGREGEAFQAEVFHAINEAANTGEFATVYSHDGIVLDAWSVPP